MKVIRLFVAAALMSAVVRVGSASAQVAADSVKKDNGSAEAQTAPRGPAVEAEQRHPFQGVVATVDANKITINAEGIPGMKQGATTLPYSIKDSGTTFKVGDRVTGDMVVKE